jgi:hypothetical protein
MTGTTDISGREGKDFGPYLHDIPVNPYNGHNTVGGGQVGTSAWFYDAKTGEFRANDSKEHAGF